MWNITRIRINAGRAGRRKKGRKKERKEKRDSRMENGAFRSGVAHCYPLSFAVKANITVIRGNCGRTKQGAGQRGATRWRHLFAASQTVNFPGTSDCPASNTQSEIAQQRSTILLLAHVSFHPGGGGGGGIKQIALLSPAVKFSTRWMRLNDLSDGKIAWKWIIQILRLALLLCMENYQQQPPQGEAGLITRRIRFSFLLVSRLLPSPPSGTGSLIRHVFFSRMSHHLVSFHFSFQHVHLKNVFISSNIINNSLIHDSKNKNLNTEKN